MMLDSEKRANKIDVKVLLAFLLENKKTIKWTPVYHNEDS